MSEPLQIWKPQCAWEDYPDTQPIRLPANHALLMTDEEAEVADLHAFHRGAARTVLHEQIFVPDDTYQGQPWYDEMPAIREMRLEWRDHNGAWHQRNGARIDHCRPQTLRFTLKIDCPRQDAPGTVRIPTDIAVANPEDPWPPNGLLLPESTFIKPEEIAQFLLDACHVPNDPSTETNSRQQQAADFKTEMYEFACKLMLTGEEAATRIIERLARTHLQSKLRELAPRRQVMISVHPDDEPTLVWRKTAE